MTSTAFLREIRRALGHDHLGPVTVAGDGALASAFAVTDLATASIAAAAAEVAALAGGDRGVTVDRRLASHWFAWSMRPVGWELPPVWDAVAGDYETADGWIRLHTNAPHHRDAALGVLGTPGERGSVATTVRSWRADDLEGAVVTAGGCAAAMRDGTVWRLHPQGTAVAAEPLIATDLIDAPPLDPAGRRADRPLAGVRVLDLTRVLAGPVATRFLAGFGADVLRIDPPGWDEPSVVPDVTLGKRCARLDLRHAADRATFDALLARADVLVHGYRGDALEHLGLGADHRRIVNPGLVDVSLDAYGFTGPWADRRGFDSLVQMSSGIAHTGMVRTGRDRPTPLPVQALDHATGYLLAAAVVRGLRLRRTTGEATTTRCSLARTAALLVDGPAGSFDDTLAPLADDDWSPAVERTAWGDVRRLLPPVTIDGAPMRWDRPATPLGAHPAAW